LKWFGLFVLVRVLFVSSEMWMEIEDVKQRATERARKEGKNEERERGVKRQKGTCKKKKLSACRRKTLPFFFFPERPAPT